MDYADIFGTDATALDMVRLWASDTGDTGDETLAQWLERQSVEIWAESGQHVDEDWQRLSVSVLEDAASDGWQAAVAVMAATTGGGYYEGRCAAATEMLKHLSDEMTDDGRLFDWLLEGDWSGDETPVSIAAEWRE